MVTCSLHSSKPLWASQDDDGDDDVSSRVLPHALTLPPFTVLRVAIAQPKCDNCLALLDRHGQLDREKRLRIPNSFACVRNST
jgi:hypothetical protein